MRINRHIFFSILAVGLTILVLSLTGCRAKTPRKNVVPNDLQTIEKKAETIFDLVSKGKWSQIATEIKAIEKAWKSYQPRALGDKLPSGPLAPIEASIKRLKKGAKDKNKTATRQAANDITHEITGLIGGYYPTIPPDVGRLMAIERQILIFMRKKDFTSATNSIGQMESWWAHLRPAVRARDGADVVKEFDKAVAGQKSSLEAKDAPGLKDQAQKGLDLLLTMESKFK